MSVSLEDRLFFRCKGPVGAREVLGGHAQGLSDGFRLNRLLDRHCPFHGKHALGHRIGVGRSRTDRSCQVLSLAKQFGLINKTAEEAPALALLSPHEAARVKKLRSPTLADDAGQDRTSAHIAASQPNLVEQ